MALPRSVRFRGFLLVTAILIAATAAASTFVVGSFFREHILAHETMHSVEMILSEVPEQLVPEVFARPLDPSSRLRFERFHEGLPGFFRIKAFDPDGVIVWSNEPRLIGQAFPEDPDFIAARAGDVRTEIGEPQGAAHRYEKQGSVAEVWVPVTFHGRPRVVGVLELYRDLTRVIAGIRRTQRLIGGVVGAAGVFVWVGLALLAWSASRSEMRAIRRLERQNAELTLLQRVTRLVLRPLDPAQVAQSVVTNAVVGFGLARAAIYRLDAAGPSLLAAWPPGVAPPSAPVGAAATSGPDARATDGSVAIPLATHKGITHFFVGDLGRATSPGEVMRSLDIVLDETAMALANAELFGEIREAHERLSAIVAGIADRMLIVDQDMRVVWMNAASLDTSGRAEDVLGAPCVSALRMDRGGCEDCPAARTFRSGQVERGVRVESSAGGVARYMDLVTAPLRDGSGRVYQVLELARDITERVRMEERLKETNQALVEAQAKLVEKERLAAVGQVVVALHHAILNPLTGILGALQVLKTGGDDAARRETLAAAEAEVRKIEQLVRQLSDLRRADEVPYVGTTTMLDLDSHSV